MQQETTQSKSDRNSSQKRKSYKKSEYSERAKDLRQPTTLFERAYYKEKVLEICSDVNDLDC